MEVPAFFGYAPLFMVGGFVSLFILERRFPLRQRTRKPWPRVLTNLAVMAINVPVGLLVVGRAAEATKGWVIANQFGLLQWVPLPSPLRLVLGFLLMDLAFYYWHRLNHVVGILWRFHAVHHIDPDMDVSTSSRFHFGEILYSSLFRIVQVGLLGVTPLVYGAYDLVFQMAVLFHHSNLRLPLPLERVVSKVLVTPRMHGVHHSHLKAENDTNFSTVFSLWDRIHRTLVLHIGQGKLTIGVAGYHEPDDNRFWRILISPFVSQRRGPVTGHEDMERTVGPRTLMAE